MMFCFPQGNKRGHLRSHSGGPLCFLPNLCSSGAQTYGFLQAVKHIFSNLYCIEKYLNNAYASSGIRVVNGANKIGLIFETVDTS